MILKANQRRHLLKEIPAVILVSNGDVFFKVSNSNGFDQFLLGFSHNVPNLRS
jgi:hypothetical protein